jgi:predicted amidophosphoribosyltransferase
MAFLFQTRCPHCRARVKKRDKTCPSCERWMDDHPDWNEARKWRRIGTIGAALFSAAVLLVWFFARK